MSYWIAVVDDEPLSLTNAKILLRARDMKVSCLRSGKDLLEFLEKNAPDLILLDILMPGMDGFETYRAVRQFEEKNGRTQIPVIFLTGEDNRETERRGLRAGASDFIHKPFDEDVLIKRINNTIVNSKTIESLTEEVKVDKLTGFFNKASGTEKISEKCRNGKGTLMIMDLDNFKLVNDLYGHDMGDRVLVEIADIIRHNVRNGDVISRIGGDEFLGFFSDVTLKEDVRSLVTRLNEEFFAKAENLMGKDHGIPLGISAGCVFVNDGADDFQLLFQFADSSLNRMKLNGKHGYEIYDPEIYERENEDDPDREIVRILKIVSERGEGRGAMFLGQEAFLCNYRFIMRFLQRYNGSANRILFLLSAKEKGVIFSEMVASFGNVLKDTLRKSDLFFQSRPDQFFVMLPQLEKNDTPGVIERIMKAWEKTGFGDRVNIEYATMPVTFCDVDDKGYVREDWDESKR